MKIRTVTIDFWGTLILEPPAGDERYERSRLSGLAAVLRDKGMEFSADQFARAYASSGRFLATIWRTGRDVAVVEPVREILRALDEKLPRLVTPETLAALVDAYVRPILLVPPTLDPGARAALDRLRESGIGLAIVSNTMRTPGTTLRTLLERLDVLRRFDHAVFSDEIGVRKPRPEIFHAALEAVGSDPVTSVHVGDDPVLDVQGAHAAGLKSIQVVARGVTSPARRPDRTITQLAELPAAIAALGGE